MLRSDVGHGCVCAGSGGARAEDAATIGQGNNRSETCARLPAGQWLWAYYAAEVIGGSGSFVEPVENPDDIASFAGALRRKLVAEVA